MRATLEEWKPLLLLLLLLLDCEEMERTRKRRGRGDRLAWKRWRRDVRGGVQACDQYCIHASTVRSLWLWYCADSADLSYTVIADIGC